MMDHRDILRAKKAVNQVQVDIDHEKDYQRRNKGRQEYRPQTPFGPPEIIHPQPQAEYVVRHVYEAPRKGFSGGQTCVLMGLASVLAIICICGGLLALPTMFPNQPKPLLSAPAPVAIQATSRPNNQTTEGLLLADVRLSPFVPDNSFTQPGPGNWWRLEVTVNNPTNKPITVRGYDIVLRDQTGNEYWYDQGMSLFGVRDGFAEQLNPGVTTVMPVVFNLPEQISGGLSVYYDRAVLPIAPEKVVR